MVFSGIYPINTADYEHLKINMAKLQLNDSAFVYQAETSVALGFGFRCGFLGLLHMEIVQERLRREYNMDIIATYPSVVYRVTLTDGTVQEVDNPMFLPEPNYIAKIEEPMVKTFIMCPNENIGDMMALVSEKRGLLDHTETLDPRRVMLTALVPLNEILIDFHDRIKSMTRGYGSMDYEHADYAEAKMVKLDLLVNGESVDAFSCIVHRDKAESRGRALAAKLKEVIPRQQYQVAIQAAIGGKVIARETVSALRKDVTAKCYGGDITRKRKLLEKQKEGKKRMKSVVRSTSRRIFHRGFENVGRIYACLRFLSKIARRESRAATSTCCAPSAIPGAAGGAGGAGDPGRRRNRRRCGPAAPANGELKRSPISGSTVSVPAGAKTSGVGRPAGYGHPHLFLNLTDRPMQPTLFGVTRRPARRPTGWARVAEWFAGVSYVLLTAKASGPIQRVEPPLRLLIFNIKQTIWIGGVPHVLWFPPDCGQVDIATRAGLRPGDVCQRGDEVINVRVQSGDHLFVDRLTYNLRAPKRGEIIVFETAGIQALPQDQFYIKRLVGLGGERVQIGEDRHLIINGERLDAGTPHFENLYSFDPQQPPRDSRYSGHVNGPLLAPLFYQNPGGVEIKPHRYMVMGDNTVNSKDSREWGDFPAKNVIGKSYFVYWPITERFGWGHR